MISKTHSFEDLSSVALSEHSALTAGIPNLIETDYEEVDLATNHSLTSEGSISRSSSLSSLGIFLGQHTVERVPSPENSFVFPSLFKSNTTRPNSPTGSEEPLAITAYRNLIQVTSQRSLSPEGEKPCEEKISLENSQKSENAEPSLFSFSQEQKAASPKRREEIHQSLNDYQRLPLNRRIPLQFYSVSRELEFLEKTEKTVQEGKTEPIPWRQKLLERIAQGEDQLVQTWRDITDPFSDQLTTLYKFHDLALFGIAEDLLMKSSDLYQKLRLESRWSYTPLQGEIRLLKASLYHSYALILKTEPGLSWDKLQKDLNAYEKLFSQLQETAQKANYLLVKENSEIREMIHSLKRVQISLPNAGNPQTTLQLFLESCFSEILTRLRESLLLIPRISKTTIDQTPLEPLPLKEMINSSSGGEYISPLYYELRNSFYTSAPKEFTEQDRKPFSKLKTSKKVLFSVRDKLLLHYQVADIRRNFIQLILDHLEMQKNTSEQEYSLPSEMLQFSLNNKNSVFQQIATMVSVSEEATLTPKDVALTSLTYQITEDRKWYSTKKKESLNIAPSFQKELLLETPFTFQKNEKLQDEIVTQKICASVIKNLGTIESFLAESHNEIKNSSPIFHDIYRHAHQTLLLTKGYSELLQKDGIKTNPQRSSSLSQLINITHTIAVEWSSYVAKIKDSLNQNPSLKELEEKSPLFPIEKSYLIFLDKANCLFNELNSSWDISTFSSPSEKIFSNINEQKIEVLTLMGKLFLMTSQKYWELAGYPKEDIRVQQLQKDHANYQDLLENLFLITEKILKHQHTISSFFLSFFSEEEKIIWQQMFSSLTLSQQLLQQLQKAQKEIAQSLQERLTLPLMTLQKARRSLPLSPEQKSIRKLNYTFTKWLPTEWQSSSQNWGNFVQVPQQWTQQLPSMPEWTQPLVTKASATLFDLSQNLPEVISTHFRKTSQDGVVPYQAAERNIQIIEKMLMLATESPSELTSFSPPENSLRFLNLPAITILEEIQMLEESKSYDQP